MKYFLLLLTLTAFVDCQDKAVKYKINVERLSNGIRLTCKKDEAFGKILTKTGQEKDNITLVYSDDNTGEYACVQDNDKIYVKFRSCDNCIELDMVSLVGMAIGEVVATSVIGVAVYFIVSQARPGQVTSKKKRSDKQHLVPNEIGNRAPNDHYQPLRSKNAQKRDEYDELQPKRR